MKQHKKKWPFFLAGLVILLTIIASIFFFYVGNYYHANQDALASLAENNHLSIVQSKDEITFSPTHQEASTGFIFYPGGKVEAAAYAPLMRQIAEQGYTCIIAEMPYNLAVFDMNAADKIMSRHPEITNWYIGGHSLGGAMAASYTSSHPEKLSGLVLLGAYSTKDLSSLPLEVLTIYGSEDTVLNMENYEKYKAYLPADTIETYIEGGNHAQYGNYGIQEGDGTATISSEKQQEIVANTICDLLR